ncbi:hypothetical protein [Streptomyces sp. NPDC057939]|uniref:hypothetical protein n=1 Tax=Streptomyces sp. NPDC057939 TaxID=3346284 RepID=UPI0036E6125B
MMKEGTEEFTYIEDFGLTGLTERLSLAHTGSATTLATALRWAEEFADGSEGENAIALGEDARRLLASGLPERVLRMVWSAAAGHAFDPVTHGMETRVWLERLSEVSVARLQQDEPTYSPPLTHPVRDERLHQAVLKELRTATPALLRASASPELVDGLERVVTEADSNVGFRLFLRVLKTHSVSVAHDDYLSLLALGLNLGFHSGVVHDGLAIRWRAIDTSRDALYQDFGLSQLSRYFTSGWQHRTPQETVLRALMEEGYDRPPGSEAALVTEDVRRLAESDLPDEVITVLWLAATNRGHNIDEMGLTGRDWLEEILGVCEQRLANVAPTFVLTPAAVRTDLAGSVLREIREMASVAVDMQISPVWRPVAADVVTDALEQTTSRVDPDLAFRLLLRTVQEMRLPITEEQYARYQVLGRQFHYSEDHFIHSIEPLVQKT